MEESEPPAVSTAEDDEQPASSGAPGLDPDHPLLQRAQQALRKQLLTKKEQVDGELREKQNALSQAVKRREAIGVELYGFQQALAKLQLTLERSQEQYTATSQRRQQVEDSVSALRQALGAEADGAKAERSRVEAHQAELQRLAATLRQVEAYNEQIAGEIAVTRRAAYATEEAVGKMEKEKLRQDYLIDDMQEALKGLQQQQSLYDAQLAAQRHETRAAQETLAAAEAEMETVHHEKRRLLAQWKSSLTAIARRDEALAAIQDAMRQQHEQQLTIEGEISGFKKAILKEQLRNEQLMGVVRKVEGEAKYLGGHVASLVERQERLAAQMDTIARSLEQMEAQLKVAAAEAKAATSEQEALDRAIGKVGLETVALEGSMLSALSGQMMAEKTGAKMAREIQELRARGAKEELRIAVSQNELAKLQASLVVLTVDMLNTEAHNEQLAEALKALDAEIASKEGAITKYEAELKRRIDEMERKTREVDALNKKLEKLLAAQPDAAHTGPLEATIASLQHEIDAKSSEGQALQRRWIAKQRELVELQQDNAALTEAIARLRAEHTVLSRKRKRVDGQLSTTEAETKALRMAMGRLCTDLSRINALIAQNSAARAALEDAHTALQAGRGGSAAQELAELEAEASKLQMGIDAGARDKENIMADIVEVEGQIMLWERKIQLEREMQEMLDPNAGQAVAMKKEIHRMELRHSELQRAQERLMVELERALYKHEVLDIKAGAPRPRGKGGAAKGGGAGAAAQRAVTELQASIKNSEREAAATRARLEELDRLTSDAERALAECDASCRELRAEREALRPQLSALADRRYASLLATSRQQRAAKRYEELEAGRYKMQVDPAQLDQEISRAMDKQARVAAALRGVQQLQPAIAAELERVLCHTQLSRGGVTVAEPAAAVVMQ